MKKINNDIAQYVKPNLWRITNLNVKSIIMKFPDTIFTICWYAMIF